MIKVRFYERKNFGDAPIYPRLIRAFMDQWSKDEKLKLYESPIANLVYSYAVLADAEQPSVRPTDFKPKPRPKIIEGEGDLVKRFAEIRNALIRLSQLKPIEELEELPPLSILPEEIEFQRALFNHELDPHFCELLGTLSDEPEAELIRLVMLAAYSLNRIALTVVQGKNEDYAFTIFESLNTTGEPLTAFETFLPRVVMAGGIQHYQGSQAHEHMTAVQNYLSRFDVGDKLQNATRDLLVTFALAETGKKLSKRLSDQRVYMKDTFDRHKDIEVERNAYLRHLSDTATFVGSTWDSAGSPQLVGLESTAMTDTIKLCLAFLKALNHTIAIAPLARFYSAAVQAAEGDERNKRAVEFESAIKAITAFTVFWRATRRGTGSIDSQYRAVMAGDTLTHVGPLARERAIPDRSNPQPTVDVSGLKAELAARLTDEQHGGVPNLASFIASAAALPLYTISQPLARFLLLAAYHDTTEDPENPGLIKPGKVGVAACFTSEGWFDEGHYTIEHIAPRQATGGWSPDFYVDKEVVHRIGNLVLAPANANSSLSSRPWTEKKVLYAALGATTADEAKSILVGSGLTFNQTTEELAQMSHYLPHLQALGQREQEWDPDFMERRAEVLLRLAYMRLKDWLGLTWSESVDDRVYRHVEEPDDIDIDIDTDDVGSVG
ncbi:HNH endonuclease family protein [Mycobacterium avium]|uniref:HNH endonuclease family protein n=1 Tax=Mycobacterium avium TaxID=1764 RepID=UPI00044BAB83|nr:HNH endonuclease family protein [Mycobacterium avium]ETZ41135.1 hypothetical protein L837_5196 [Mycobacterium avium MAV_061107_1842]